MKRTLFWLQVTAVAIAWLAMFAVLLMMVLTPDLAVNAQVGTKVAVWLLLAGQALMVPPLVAGLSRTYSALADAHEPFLITGTGQRA